MEASLSVLEAEDALKGPVADDRVYDVVLAATGDEEVASAAFTERLMMKLRKNETPEV